MRPAKSLLARGGLARTFGGLAGFLAVIFLCWGLYILEDTFANPLNAGAAAVISAAFILTLAATLLFFLIKPTQETRTEGHHLCCDSAPTAVRPFFNPAAGAVRYGNLRNNLAYQRFYVDHSRIRP
jgi:hypothetical protein